MVETIAHRFTVTLVDEGAIPIDFDQRAIFGKARAPVIVALGSYSYRSTIAVMNGKSFVPLRRSNREAAGVKGGDTIEVILTLDTAPRTVALIEPLDTALDTAGVRTGWDKLSFTAQREQAEAVVTAKRPETRDRRIAAAIALAKTRMG